MRRVICALLLVSGCGEQAGGVDPTRVAVDVHFGSHLPVTTLEVDVDWGGQSAQGTQEVLPHVGPRGPRTVRSAVDLPADAAGQTAAVRVVGRAAAGTPIGAGTATVTVVSGATVAVPVVLGPPGTCGDGQLQVAEACDDGNLTSGDGCSETCEIESTPAAWTRAWAWNDLTSEGTALVQVAEARVPPSGAAQLVLTSGLVTGDDMSTVDVRVQRDADVVDELGYQLRGDPSEAGVGFLTFAVLPASPQPQTVSLWARASVGTARLRKVRMVVVRLPPAVALVSVASSADAERAGRDLTLEALEIPPGQGGRYLVLAKMSLSEAPGGSTARAWLSLPDGSRRPLDDRGATFSAPRDPLSPLFTAAVLDVPASGATLRLQGSSSGGGALDGWAEPAAAFRVPLSVSGPAEAGYAVRLTFDHAGHVARGRSLPDGSDVLIVHRPVDGGSARLHRVVDPASGWNRPDTTVWFQLPAAVNEAGTDAFDLFMGGPAEPLADPAMVFPFFDGFDRRALGSGWVVVDGTGVSLDGGRLRVQGPAALATATGAAPDGSCWEAGIQLLDPVPAGLTYLAAAAEGTVGATLEGAALRAVDGGHQAVTTAEQAAVRPQAPASAHVYAIRRLGPDRVAFTQDGAALTALIGAPATAATWPVGIFNEGTSGALYDWVRVRPCRDPEPTVTPGALAGPLGAAPSTFGFRKLVAVRLDGWARARSAASTETVRTSGPYAVAAALDLAPGTGDRLVLQSVRVGGANDATARRRGEARLNGRAVRVTGHRIDRDDTDRNGYHHIAGIAHVVSATVTGSLEVGVTSPDGIEVSGADGRVIVVEQLE